MDGSIATRRNEYLNVSEIFGGDERVKCTFEVDAAECGYLDPSSDAPNATIAAGTEVELPLWLAETLAQRGDVRVEAPPYLTSRFRRLLQAGPSSVNLRDFSSYVYQVGRHMMPLVEEEEKQEMNEILKLSYAGERYKAVLNNAMNALDEDTTEFTRKLTEEEKKIFHAGVEDSSSFTKWKARKAGAIKTAPIVARAYKKRRL